METRSRKRIRLCNESRQLSSQNKFGVQGMELKTSNLSDDKGNFENQNRVAKELDVIYNVGLPMICWQQGMITSHLSDDDLETLINSSPFFRELLKNKRIFYLTEMVFKILSNWLNSKELFDFFFDGLIIQKSLLHSRLVCKSWCSSFDNLVQHLKLIGAPVSLESYRVYPNRVSNWPATNFFEHFEKTHPPHSTTRSPLLTRDLVSSKYSPEIMSRMLSVLQSYGKHIWHLELHFNYNPRENVTSRQQTYLNFREMLMLSPNLKYLTISYTDWDKDNLVYESLMRTHPLPKLLSLQTLQIDNARGDIFTHLLSQNDHITKFKTTHYYCINVKLDKLTEFHMECRYVQRTPVISVRWPVKKLFLEFRDSKFECTQQFFEMISYNCGETCEEIQLSWNYPSLYLRGKLSFQNCVDCRLDLPRVKILDLKMIGESTSIDFLLKMKSLEKITIRRGYSSSSNRVPETGAIVQFKEFQNKMYESNIWHLFPKLKILYFTWGRIEYRRCEWIERLKKNSEVE